MSLDDVPRVTVVARGGSRPLIWDFYIVGAPSLVSLEASPLRFSIVTPVLNGMPWLPQCVQSVAEQRATTEVEHIILDAGSTDGSRAWLADHRELGYELIFEPDRGQTDALIKGFERASGDVFGWLNADDRLEPGALQRTQQAFEDHPGAALVSGCCILVDADDNILGAIPTPPVATLDGLMTHTPNPAQPATFFPADAYWRVGALDPRYDLAMDVDLWLKLARIGEMVFLRNEVLARFRVHPEAKSVASLGRTIRQDFGIRRRNGLSLRSDAGQWFVRHGYIAPWWRPVRGKIVHAIKSLALH